MPFLTASLNALCSNLAVGGNWAGPPDDTTPLPATLAVDYVRIFGTN